MKACDPRNLRRLVVLLNAGPGFAMTPIGKTVAVPCDRARLHKGNFQVRVTASGVWHNTSVFSVDTRPFSAITPPSA